MGNRRNGRTAFVMSASPASGKQKLLMLHGYRQNQTTFHAKTGALRRALRGAADLVYVDGTYPSGEGAGRAWWHATDDGRRYVGLQHSINSVAETVERQGPFDGILGFSQGAVFASLLASHPDTQRHWRYAIMISGFPARAESVCDAEWYQTLQMPSLHIWGASDELVPPAASALLADSFTSPQIHVHERGHLPPFDRPSTDALAAFVASFAESEPAPSASL